MKSLLRRCEQLRASEGTNTRVSRIGFGLDRVVRTVSFLEKRWQTLWLTSLEWQCLVEQLLDSQQDQRVAVSRYDGFFYEPLRPPYQFETPVAVLGGGSLSARPRWTFEVSRTLRCCSASSTQRAPTVTRRAVGRF